MGAIVGVLGTLFTKVAGSLFYAFFTEKIVIEAVIYLLRKLAKSTKNGLDDKIVNEAEANLKK